jgi:hypothetical protein
MRDRNSQPNKRLRIRNSRICSHEEKVLIRSIWVQGKVVTITKRTLKNALRNRTCKCSFNHGWRSSKFRLKVDSNEIAKCRKFSKIHYSNFFIFFRCNLSQVNAEKTDPIKACLLGSGITETPQDIYNWMNNYFLNGFVKKWMLLSLRLYWQFSNSAVNFQTTKLKEKF